MAQLGKLRLQMQSVSAGQRALARDADRLGVLIGCCREWNTWPHV